MERNAEQLEKLRSRIQALEQSLEKDRSRRDDLREQLEDSEQRYVELSATLGDLRDRITEQSARRRRTEAQRREADTLMQRHKKSLARQVRASYIIGQRGQTKLVLNQDGSQELSRVMTYYDYLNRARARRIERILDQVQALTALSETLKRETAELDITRSRHEGTLSALEALRTERQEMVKALRERITGEEEELHQLQADEKQLTRLLRELRKTLSDIPANLGAKPFARLRGKLPWPLRGRLLAQYGEPKSARLKWKGLWIAGAEGTPVKAVAQGRVAYTGWMHRYGLIAVLEHEGGYYSLYGHNQSVAVTAGDWVQPNDVIAAVGATGGHEKNGLYFELRKGTEPINPKPWLKVKK
ncbi:MAG TPA: peptidoglycan DD-metalloendopeptidase family protein [Burkholderiales bacterium]|nr:peptidoglycan DD-metalloendopeptidase family protein [Burkholderiales bacterium]